LIYGGSQDPVLIKKIQLKLWTLRSEVENTIKILIKEKKRELTPEEIEMVKEEYSFKKPVASENNLLLLNGGKEDEAGDDAEVSAESSEETEETEENGDEGDSDEDLEAAMAAAMGGGDDSAESEEASEQEDDNVGIADSVKIIQRSSDILPREKVAKGVTILSELGIDSMSFFTSKPFLMGQSIVIEFNIPKRFVINADIILCRPINIKSRIISQEKLSYRAIAKFTFLKQGERTLLRSLLKSIEPEIPAAPVKTAKAAQEEDDDFDDLDSLDF
jgi:hypothetical protein